MSTATLSSKGQLVIPKPVRESARLATGDVFAVRWVEGELRLTPIPRITPTTVDEVAGCLSRPGRKRLTDKETRARIVARIEADDAATR